MVTADRIIRDLGQGSVTKAAAAMGVSRQALHKWRNTKKVPELYQDRYRVRVARVVK